MKNDILRTQSVPKSGNVTHFSKIIQLSAALLLTFSITAQAEVTDSPAGNVPATEVTQQNTVKVSGTVVDHAGIPVIGANVTVKGKSEIGTITNMDGQFTLDVPANATLLISYIGYKNQEVKVVAGKSLSIKLQEDSELLGEVVVTALGIKREEKALGYAVQKVSGDKLTTVKTVDIATGLTGKIAGLNIQNSTEFNEAPTLTLRGESPLIVIDGVPYRNMTLRDIAPDDIESIDVLKGATASALYGARGGSGAVMITTKRGKEEGLNVTVNSSTMFNAGYLKMPEVQSAYSSGNNGKYNPDGSYVWGQRLDEGKEAEQYNPVTHKWEMMPLTSKGKNNLDNFSELSFITNNNVSITQKGKYGSFRTSLTHVYNKGQWPGEKLNKITYSVSGDMKFDKFTAEAGITYNKRFYPNMGGTGYGGNGYLYNLLVWSGAEYDVRDYKDYWIREDEQVNWWAKSWYQNPYFLANEVTTANDYDVVNAFINASYEFKPWLKLALRSGADIYTEKTEWTEPVCTLGGYGEGKGYYAFGRKGGYSMNNDVLLMADHKFGDFAVDGFVGGNIYFYQNDNVYGQTAGGLIMPAYYSLLASTDPAQTSKTLNKKQTNSIYGKVSLAYKSAVFVDVTGRNDWSSTLPEETRSYFYPAVSGSLVLSEFIPMPKVVDFWKIRGSWTTTKNDMDVYAINNTYTMSTNVWDNMSGAYTPDIMRNSLLSPSQSRSYEIGTAFNMFGNRLRVDYTYYNKLKFNNTRNAGLTPTSGYTQVQVNMDEEQVRKGMELTISGDIIKTKELTWAGTFNWSRDRYYYAKIDPIYSTQKPWVAKGERWDWLGAYDYQKDPQGNIVHGKDGMPLINPYETVQGYTSPDWMWGFNTSVSYKNFTLSLSLDGRVGGIAFSKTDQAMWNSGSHIDSDNDWRYDEVVNGNKKGYVGQGVKVVSGEAHWDTNGKVISDNRVFAPNDIGTSYQGYTTKINPYVGSVRTQNLFDQTFIKLRDISISYALPKSLCEKIKMKGASVGFVGQNLLMWTKDFRFSDPDKEDNISSPSIRYAGFNVKFDF